MTFRKDTHNCWGFPKGLIGVRIVIATLLSVSSYYFVCLHSEATQYPIGAAKPSQSVQSSQPASVATQATVETYLTPYNNAESRLLEFLDQAKTRCYIASYSLTNRNIVSELIQLHNRGVDVQILTDRTQASGRSEQAVLVELQASNIPVFIGKSIDNALMHCKFAVIDDHLTEDGSWNFTTSANKEDNVLNFVDSKTRAAQFLNYWFKIKSDMK